MKVRADDTMELNFGDRKAPEVSPDDVDQLISLLTAAGDWTTAQELAARVPAWNERKVRAIASAACPNVVSYPGSRGYKVWQLCTVEEITHCIAAFETQAKEMTKRAVMYQTAYHRHHRG